MITWWNNITLGDLTDLGYLKIHIISDIIYNMIVKKYVWYVFIDELDISWWTVNITIGNKVSIL